MLNGQWIEVFRSGDYGEKGNYTNADIDRMIASYNPANHEVPLVIGHPEHDKPAVGWVESLKRMGDVMLAKLKQVAPEFEQMVRQGRFKKRSISFYKAPELQLRHVGFLGALPPEVKGLADVRLASFRDGDREVRAIEFKEEEKEMTLEEMRTAITDAFKSVFGDKKPATFSEDDVKRISQEAVTAATKPLTDKLSEVSTQFSDLKKSIESGERTRSVTVQAESAISKLKADGKWIPAFDKMGAPQIFAELAKSDVKVEFGEGDKKTQKPIIEVFSDFLAGLPKIVPAGEIARGATSARKGGNLVQFNEPHSRSGAVVDQDSVELAEMAQQLANKEKIPYGEALIRARRELLAAQAGAV
jgi:hypothetical protein